MHNIKLKECVIFITFFFIIMILYHFNLSIPCLFHKITNIYCPGCGVTRMFYALLHLKFIEAFSYNAFAFILLCLCIIYNIINFIYWTIKKEVIKLPNYIYYTLIVLAIIFMIIRNIPYFNFLAP